MVTIFADVPVQDFATFIGVFTTRGRAMRTKHGCLKAEVFVGEAPTQLRLKLTWRSRPEFDAFLADPQVKETMKSSGVVSPPIFTVMDRVCTVDG